MDNRTNVELRATAYHEAGHCVAGVVYGRPIRYVTINRGKRKNPQGQVMEGRTLFRHPPKVQSAEDSKAFVEGALMSCYAGAICQAAFTGKPVDPSCIAEDHRGALAMIRAFLGPDAAPETLHQAVSGLYQGTQKLFLSPKVLRAAKRVADALMARRTLTGGEVKRIVLQALDSKD